MRHLSVWTLLVVGLICFGIACGDDDDPAPPPEVDDSDEDPESDEFEDLADVDEVPPIGAGSVDPGPGEVRPREEEPHDVEPAVLGEFDGDGVQPVEDQPVSFDDTMMTTPMECPRSYTFWQHHLATAQVGQHSVGVGAQERELCGMSWEAILVQPSQGGAWVPLAREYIAARLNIAAGVDAPVNVSQDLSQARHILNACRAMRSTPQTAERRLAGQLTRSLAGFNQGPCPAVPGSGAPLRR